MERRRESRTKVDQPVNIFILDDLGQGDHGVLSGRVSDLSGRGIRLFAPQYIPIGTALRIEMDDSLFLAEVCYCRPAADGYAIGVQVDQALRGIGEIARLRAALLGAQTESEPESVRPGLRSQ